MPLYDFACPACGERFEERTAAGEQPPCPACGVAAERRLSPFAGPFTVAPRGTAARRSNANRAAREEARRERREARRQAQGEG